VSNAPGGVVDPATRDFADAAPGLATAEAAEPEPEPAPGGRRRAAPLTPDDRRAAVLDAVLPLVAERGAGVTTRELAAAAGVAEGTLFRAFPDKATLVAAAALEGLRRASRPAQTRAELAAVDRSLPLERRLELVIERGRARAGEAFRWMAVLRTLHCLDAGRAVEGERVHELRAQLLAQREMQRAVTIEGISAVLAPDADRLRVPVDVAVGIIDAVVAGGHAHPDPLLPAPPAAVVADALVHGLLGAAPAAAAATTASPTPTAPAPGKDS
jgi:AcrR family transcriptional regulator